MASLRSFNKEQIADHTEAARKLGLIKDEFHSHILENVRVSELEGIDFIKKAYKKHGLVNDSKKEFAIVAFGKNTKEVHYFPKGKGLKLKPNTLILLDIWARLDKKNAPYADMTWMFYFGKKVPKDILSKWNILKKARDTALNKIRSSTLREVLPSGVDIDRAAHDVIGGAGFGNAIKHTIGHSLGFDSPHGKLPGINWRKYSPLLPNVGYTIEPGMYFDKFGMRTEIDFYIDKSGVVITTPLQKEIEII
ncbi:MAG: M24 family metallopeptidase [Patescibacteria group bacterium]